MDYREPDKCWRLEGHIVYNAVSDNGNILHYPVWSAKKQSMPLCQERLRKTTSQILTKQQRWQLIPNCIYHVPQGGGTMLRWWPAACICLCSSVLVYACVCIPLLFCLYIPCVNRVAGSCPWISIDRECGICWVFLYISLRERAGGGFVDSDKVTQWRPDRRYAIIWGCYNQEQVSKQNSELKIMLNIFTNLQFCKSLRIKSPIIPWKNAYLLVLLQF